jgi:hypothetical protein
VPGSWKAAWGVVAGLGDRRQGRRPDQLSAESVGAPQPPQRRHPDLVRGSLRTRHGGAVVGCTHPHLADWSRPPTRGVRIGLHATARRQADPARLLGDPRLAWSCSNCFHGAAHEQPNTADTLSRAPFGRLPTRQVVVVSKPPPSGSACGPLPPRQATVILAGRALHVPVAPASGGPSWSTAVGRLLT